MTSSKLEVIMNLAVYDIDETLFHTNSRIIVRSSEGVKYLSNTEFNTYELKTGESFDFIEFTNSKTFFDKSEPIQEQIDALNADIQSGKDVYLVTARNDFDSKDVFLDTFRKHGIDIDKVRVERAGKIKDINDVAIKKKLVIYNILRTKQYKTAKLVDDSKENLKEFLSLKSFFPSVNFFTELAK